MPDTQTEFDYRSGDILLIKIIEKRVGKPAKPSGEVYSGREFYLFDTQAIDSIGDTVPMRIFAHGGDLSAKNTDSNRSNEEIFQDWMDIQEKRLDEVRNVVELGEVPDEINIDNETVEKQDSTDKKETSEFDEWVESKSDKMDDLL